MKTFDIMFKCAVVLFILIQLGINSQQSKFNRLQNEHNTTVNDQLIPWIKGVVETLEGVEASIRDGHK